MTMEEAQRPPSRRTLVVGIVAIVAAIFATGAMVAQRTRRQFQAEEVQILTGVRRVCKLATVELSIADYARKVVPKTVDLPFTEQPEAFLFYSGIVSAGFDVCDHAAGVDVNHRTREVRVTLPPPRLLSVDILRFEIINERTGLLNGIPPEERNHWYADARASLEKGALAQGALERAQTHARELFEGFVEKYGYTLAFDVEKGPTAAAPVERIAR
jgi:hypothetical protein